MTSFEFKTPSELEYDESTNESIDKNSGLKLWESAIDLVEYLETTSLSLPPNSTGLELGCGMGIPGLFLVKQLNISRVYFQDYSLETINKITQPCLSLNLPEPAISNSCEFLSLPWSEFPSNLKFDLILSSECIYDQTHFESLASILRNNLRNNYSIALFAGKKYYFGCGGGTLPFKKYLEKSEFLVTVVKVIENGVSNIREILQIKKQ
jgi:Lysine methyltransferase